MSVEYDFNALFPEEIILSNEHKDIDLSKSELNQLYKTYINDNHNEQVTKYKRDIEQTALKKPIILKGHKDKVTSIATSIDNTLLVSGGHGGIIKVWNLKTCKSIRDIETENKRTIWSVDISYDNQYIASGDTDSIIRVWDLENKHVCHTLLGHEADITSVEFTKDGQFLISSSVDKSIKVWDFRNEELIQTLHGHASTVRDISLSMNDECIVSCGYDNKIRIWDFKSGDLLETIRGRSSKISSIETSRDDAYVVSSNEDYSIEVWDFAKNTILKTIIMKKIDENENEEHYPNPSVISPDNTYIISARNKTIYIWDLEDAKLVREFVGHDSQINSLLISSNNKYIISASDDHDIHIVKFSHLPSPYQEIDYKVFALIDYFTKKYKLHDSLPILEIEKKGEFEKKSDYMKRIIDEEDIHNEKLREFDTNTSERIMQYANTIISTIYGLPFIVGKINYNAEDEYFTIRIKFNNIKNIYKLLVDVPIDVAPEFKISINSINIQSTFKRTNGSLKINQILFIYRDMEYKARNT